MYYIYSFVFYCVNYVFSPHLKRVTTGRIRYYDLLLSIRPVAKRLFMAILTEAIAKRGKREREGNGQFVPTDTNV